MESAREDASVTGGNQNTKLSKRRSRTDKEGVEKENKAGADGVEGDGRKGDGFSLFPT